MKTMDSFLPQRRGKLALAAYLTLTIFFIPGCTPKVEVAMSEKPITINLNVKIDHEVKIKVEKDLESEVFSENSDLF